MPLMTSLKTLTRSSRAAMSFRCMRCCTRAMRALSGITMSITASPASTAGPICSQSMTIEMTICSGDDHMLCRYGSQSLSRRASTAIRFRQLPTVSACFALMLSRRDFLYTAVMTDTRACIPTRNTRWKYWCRPVPTAHRQVVQQAGGRAETEHTDALDLRRPEEPRRVGDALQQRGLLGLRADEVLEQQVEEHRPAERHDVVHELEQPGLDPRPAERQVHGALQARLGGAALELLGPLGLEACRDRGGCVLRVELRKVLQLQRLDGALPHQRRHPAEDDRAPAEEARPQLRRRPAAGFVATAARVSVRVLIRLEPRVALLLRHAACGDIGAQRSHSACRSPAPPRRDPALANHPLARRCSTTGCWWSSTHSPGPAGRCLGRALRAPPGLDLSEKS
eukprot:COSAG04_NODE_11_length_42922_cov_38.819700_6_plen_396_part_00